MRTRGFEAAVEGITLPKRATKYSAGYDFFLNEDVLIPAKSTVVINTNVLSYMQDDEFLSIHIRSSFGIKKGLRLKNQVGIIDKDYYKNPSNGGVILVAIENTTNADVALLKGEAFVQGIFMKYLLADIDEVTTTRSGGVGSTSIE